MRRQVSSTVPSMRRAVGLLEAVLHVPDLLGNGGGKSGHGAILRVVGLEPQDTPRCRQPDATQAMVSSAQFTALPLPTASLSSARSRSDSCIGRSLNLLKLCVGAECGRRPARLAGQPPRPHGPGAAPSTSPGCGPSARRKCWRRVAVLGDQGRDPGPPAHPGAGGGAGRRRHPPLRPGAGRRGDPHRSRPAPPVSGLALSAPRRKRPRDLPKGRARDEALPPSWRRRWRKSGCADRDRNRSAQASPSDRQNLFGLPLQDRAGAFARRRR